jgi:6-phosphogluconolactonase
MKRLAFAAAVLAFVLVPVAQASPKDDQGHGAVYTMTNSATGNAVLAFARGENGSLTQTGTYATGGLGGALGSGHSIVVSRDGETVVAVNAGSDSVSAFEVRGNGLRLVATVPSGGAHPTSVTIHDELVYVLNAGSLSIAGFRLDHDELEPIAGSVQALGAGAAVPSQLQFTNDGKVLVADSRGSNTFDAFTVDRRGVAGPAITTPAIAAAPFGFDFDRAGHLLTSNANLGNGSSGASSYDVGGNGVLTANGGGVSSGQAAACWLAAARGFAYTTNAGSGSIGRFAVGSDGTLSLTGTTLIGAGGHPLDLDATTNEREVYVLVDGFHLIVGYRIERDGSLTQIASAPVPAGAGGLAAS